MTQGTREVNNSRFEIPTLAKNARMGPPSVVVNSNKASQAGPASG